MKIITKEWLEEKGACADGMLWFLSQNETDTAKVMVKLVEEKRYIDALWILKNVSSTEQLCRVAVFASKQVLPIYEAYERSNDAPRKAIAAAELAIANPTEENKRAARAAARAAVRAAAYAAFAARAAAAEAADEAADEARAAARAADAEAAAAGAARKEMQLKIINYAVEICGL
jgi:hypothetical protein